MATQVDELQVKDFLKRAEIRTMKKDLRKLREKDALRERDKIVNIKTIEEQKQEQEEIQRKTGLERVLQKNTEEERQAEKQIKGFANESEKQQIFIFEAQRLELEKQAETIEKEKEPVLLMEKNKIMIEKRNWEEKLKEILAEEGKVESEQKILSDREKQSNVPSEKKSLEQGRWAIEDQRQKIEKKRWVVEKGMVDIENKIKEADLQLQKLAVERLDLRNKIKAIDENLRATYSKTISREDEKRTREEVRQKIAAEEKLKADLGRNEKIRREQWTHSTGPGQASQLEKKEFLKNAPKSLKEKLAESAATEEEQRKKFLQDVEKQAKEVQWLKIKPTIKAKAAQNDNGVVLADGVLKFHENDTRIKYKEDWEKKIWYVSEKSN